MGPADKIRRSLRFGAKRAAQSVVCGCKIRLERNRFLQRLDGLRILAVGAERVSEIVMRLGELGADGNGRLVAGQRLLQLSPRAQRIAAIIERFDISRIEGDGLVIARDRLVEPSERRQSQAEIGMGRGDPRIDGDGPGDQGNAALEILILQRDHAGEMQGVEMARLQRQDSLVKGQGLGQETALMKAESALEPIPG